MKWIATAAEISVGILAGVVVTRVVVINFGAEGDEVTVDVVGSTSDVSSISVS